MGLEEGDAVATARRDALQVRERVVNWIFLDGVDLVNQLKGVVDLAKAIITISLALMEVVDTYLITSERFGLKLGPLLVLFVRHLCLFVKDR